MKLNKKQKILLDFVDAFTKSHDYSPTYREIMHALGYKSVSTVAKHVDNLVVLGQLVKREGEARSLEVVGLDTSQSTKPWWAELEQQISVRKNSTDITIQAEADILRQALEIVRK